MEEDTEPVEEAPEPDWHDQLLDDGYEPETGYDFLNPSAD